MMHKAWCSIVEVPYYSSWSSIKFQGQTGWKINDFNPIWVWLLGRSQLSNPSDLPCFICVCVNGWVNNATGGLRCHRAHYDVIVMLNPNDVFIVKFILFGVSRLTQGQSYIQPMVDCMTLKFAPVPDWIYKTTTDHRQREQVEADRRWSDSS